MALSAITDWPVSNLPEPMRQMRRFLLSKVAPGHNGRLRKLPFYIDGRPRKGPLDIDNDVDQLATLDDALKAYVLGGYRTLGFALVAGDGLGVIDLDYILDETGELIPGHPGYELALEAKLLGAYIERSLSKRGLHILGPCVEEEPYSKDGVEAWGAKRFLALTGDVWANASGWRPIDSLRSSLGASKARGDDGFGFEPGIITPKVLTELDSALSAIPPDDYHLWINMGIALASIPHDKGKALWLSWSAKSDKFDDAVARAKWDTFDPTNTDHRAVFAEAQRRGWKNPRSRDLVRQPVEGEIVDPSDISEDAIARAFTAAYRNALRFDHSTGCWFEWNGTRWERDDTARAFHYARELGRKLSDGQRSMCKAAVAAGAERFARSDPAHATTGTKWDTNPFLLGTPHGTVNLKTGELCENNPRDMITKLTGTTPERGEPTLWLKFLSEALAGDEEAIDFLQLWFGYCLTGDTREHSLTFLYGPGGSGKSVCINTLVAILGDYAVTSTMDTFTASRFDRHSTDLAMLRGARLVTATETEEGRAWAEARIKQLTGGDPITARLMRQDNFTFRPEFKLMIAGNHAPSLRNVDDAMKRRLLVVPFTAKPKAPDSSLETKLRAEHGRILHWAIEGCLNWQTLGLSQPSAVTTATEDYFNDQDLFAQWLEDRCDLGERRTAPPSELYRSWSEYARAAGDDAGTMKSFVSELQRRGFISGKSNGARVYRGLSLQLGFCEE